VGTTRESWGHGGRKRSVDGSTARDPRIHGVACQSRMVDSMRCSEAAA
jgi:hypothetical protein